MSSNVEFIGVGYNHNAQCFEVIGAGISLDSPHCVILTMSVGAIRASEAAATLNFILDALVSDLELTRERAADFLVRAARISQNGR